MLVQGFYQKLGQKEIICPAAVATYHFVFVFSAVQDSIIERKLAAMTWFTFFCLSVRQSNDSDCIYICVMTGQTGRTISPQSIALLILSVFRKKPFLMFGIISVCREKSL